MVSSLASLSILFNSSILDITSFGWSGSGAYHDLLREFDNVELACKGDWEFSFLWDVDGVHDLDYKLCKKCCRVYDSDMAFHRFLNRAQVLSKEPLMSYTKVYPNGLFYELCKAYVDKLVKIKFPARSFNDWVYPTRYDKYIQRYNRIVKKLLGNHIVVGLIGKSLSETLQYYNPHEMLIAYKPTDFMAITQDFIQDLIDRARTDNSKVFVSDQMLPPDNQDLFTCYFKEPIKSIIVRRDPRDTYIAMRESGKFPNPIPRDVNDFVWFYKSIVMSNIMPDSDNRLSLNFEDLIYEYDSTINKIQKFVSLGNHITPRSDFDPDISKNNTQLFGLHTQYAKEVAIIEKELPDALYPFHKYHFERTSSIIF